MTVPRLPEDFVWAENIQLGTPEVYRLSQMSWPRFLLEESDIPDPILKFQIGLQDFKERFKVFGIRHFSSGLLVAFIQAVHVEIDLEAKELPDLGWRFSLQNASQRSIKNAMSLIEASVDPNFRGHGLSKMLIDRVKSEAQVLKLPQLIAPVRPTLKAKFQSETVEFYCQRKDAKSRIFDPWLRAHVEAGADIINVCHNSVCVKATLDKWRDWTGLQLSASGPTLVEGALMPVLINTETNIGIYSEPNVWVRYKL